MEKQVRNNGDLNAVISESKTEKLLRYGSVNVIVCETPQEVAKVAFTHFNSVLQAKPNCVIGFATGSSPLQTYNELIEAYKRNEITFANTTAFNLDEYFGLDGDHKQSYRYFMDNNLFKHIDIRPYRTNVLNGKALFYQQECRAFEEKINSVGGIDMWLLGIGRNGHIAFNEPGSSVDSRTRLTHLAPETMADIIKTNVFGEDHENIPKLALTVGVGTILEARKLVLIATGKGKAEAIQKSLEGPVSPQTPGSFLRAHRDITFILDEEAASLLKGQPQTK